MDVFWWWHFQIHWCEINLSVLVQVHMKCVFESWVESRHWVRLWHGTWQVTNIHLSQWWPVQCTDSQGCQPVRNFRILYGFYMQNTGVRIWPRKYGNWALSVLSLKVLLPEQSLPVLGSKSVRICGILCLRTFKYLFNHQNIQSSLFHM